MQQHSSKRILYIGVGCLIGVLVILGFAFSKRSSATITVAIAPQSATITINGKKGHSGMNNVSPGPVTVTAVHPGFATLSRTVIVQKGTDGYVGLVLTSNSAATNNWYETHPADLQASSVISSKQSDINASQSVKNTPIIQILPYIGPGFEWRVDYGVNPSEKAAQTPAIYINALTPRGRSDALFWIKSRGYDLATMKIIFTANPE